MIEESGRFTPEEGHVYPWWLAYTFDNPLRWLIHRPRRLFDGLVGEGQTALDVGCGLGYFTVGLARMVGETGRVIAVDVQEGMLAGVRRRAGRAGVLDRVRLQQSRAERMGLTEPVDFALAFWMVHEVPDKEAFFDEVAGLLRPGGRFLMVEPKMHVSGAAFGEEVKMARAAGLRQAAGPKVAVSRAALFVR